MTTPQLPRWNPLDSAPPVVGGAPVIDPAAGRERRVINKFRAQIHALGLAWVIFGVLVTAAGVFVLLSANEGTPRLDQVKTSPYLAYLICCVGASWIAIGVLTCLKQMWSVYVGLVLTCAMLCSNLIELRVVWVMIEAAIIVQAHRILGYAKKLSAAGIALTTQP